MVFNAVNNDCCTIGFIDQIANYAEKFSLPLFIDYCTAVLYSKYRLQEDLMIGICHITVSS
jgi:hypothetical protein